MLNFLPMSQCPKREGEPYLILRHGNDAAAFLVQQVQFFEGEMYPDAMAFAVDYEDRITDAVGWQSISGISPPETVEITHKEGE